jgi:hypothetical protein
MADHPGLTMSAYRKFNDTLQSAAQTSAPPKPPKASKVDPIEQPGAEPLGGLGGLGAAEPKIQKSTSPLLAAERATATWSDAEAERAAIIEHDGMAPCP